MALRPRPPLLGIALAALLAAGPAVADPHDLDAVRLAVGRGEIRPLADILAGVRDQLPGDVVGVEVEKKNGSWVYELRTVDGKGRLFDVYVDARDGRIERIKEK
jgi:uncharacterized membrane protein YkoI